MAMTHKQEAFAQAIASGKTQADAYRLAYNADNMKDASVWSKASVLMSDVKVTSRVEELRGKLEKKELWTREMSVKVLIGAWFTVISLARSYVVRRVFNTEVDS